jgi:hypothetical protein
MEADMAGPSTDYGDLKSNRKFVATTVFVQFRQSAGETLASHIFFTATRSCRPVNVSAVHEVAGNDAGAVTLQVKKHTGTQAPGTGTDLLQATVNLKGTANTVQSPAVIATAASKLLAVGDRLGIALTGTPTSLAGLVVTVELEMMTG